MHGCVEKFFVSSISKFVRLTSFQQNKTTRFIEQFRLFFDFARTRLARKHSQNKTQQHRCFKNRLFDENALHKMLSEIMLAEAKINVKNCRINQTANFHFYFERLLLIFIGDEKQLV